MKLLPANFTSPTDYLIYDMGYKHGTSCSEYAQVIESIFKILPSDIDSMPHAGIDAENLKDELGDILFYIVTLADMLGTNLGELQRGNQAKLEKRYPLGYTDADKAEELLDLTEQMKRKQRDLEAGE